MNLAPLQRKAIGFLAKSPLRGKFYWTGGTLLAYHYLNHRKSVDVDFFSDGKISFEEINDWAQGFKRIAGFKEVTYQKIFDRWEFLFENSESLRVEFVYYNRDKKPLGKRRELLGVKIDSLEDIAANKTFAYFDRNEPKDLFDLYFLITRCGFTVPKLLKLVERKFGAKFNEAIFWSEFFKTFPLLKDLKPLISGSERKKAVLLKKVVDYFKNGSNEFLSKRTE